MYGSTYSVNTPASADVYQYMYSTQLKNDLCEKIGAKLWQSTYDVSRSIMKGLTILYSGRTGNSAITLKQLENLDRLYDIGRLDTGWNGHGSREISKKVLSISKTIIDNICEQPSIYPTGRATVQMQYELEDRSYLEFEIFEEKIVCMKVPKRVYADATVEIMNALDMDVVNTIVGEFYGR